MTRTCLTLATLLLSVLQGCTNSSPLTPESLRAARAKWTQTEIETYDLTLKIEGDRVSEGIFDIKIAQGKLIRTTRNKVQFNTTASFYTIDGFFTFLENELEIMQHPARYFGTPPDTRIYLRAQFDPIRGYPTRYLRALPNTPHNITIEILNFSPSP